MTLPSGYEAVYPRWHRCRQCQRPMLLLVLYYHCLQTAPLNISRALFFFFGCVELRLTEQWDGATVPLQGLAHTKHGTLFCFAHSYHTISSFFWGLKKKKKRKSDCFLVRGYENQKKIGLTRCQRQFLHVTNCQEKAGCWTRLFNTDSIQNKHCHCWHGDMCCLRPSANLTNTPTLPC